MYVILEILADSEYSEGGFKFCGIYENLKRTIELLQPGQLCTQININETISDQIGPGVKVDEFIGDEKLTLTGKKYKVNDPQIIFARSDNLIEWKVHKFKYYYNFNDTIYAANHILFKKYNHYDDHTYADHVILLDDVFDYDKFTSADTIASIFNRLKPSKIEVVNIRYNDYDGNINIECADEQYKKLFIDIIINHNLISSNLTTHMTDRDGFYSYFRNRMYTLRKNSQLDFSLSKLDNNSLIYKCIVET